MKNIKIIVATILMSVAIFMPVSAHAYSLLGSACDKKSESSSVCKDNKAANNSPIYGPDGIINRVANLLAIIGGMIAVVFIMYNGLKLIMSSGDSKRLSEARDGIIYAAIGIVVIVLARVIIGFVLGLV